jgi:predicted aldo/keto reductase-like oxidoreductase
VLSLPVTTLISGVDTLEWLKSNASVAANFKPCSPEEMQALEKRCSGQNQYEPYRQWAYLDGQGLHDRMA